MRVLYRSFGVDSDAKCNRLSRWNKRCGLCPGALISCEDQGFADIFLGYLLITFVFRHLGLLHFAPESTQVIGFPVLI
jgi:hypothetical protein